MLSDLMRRVQECFRPYTMDDFMRDGNPQDHRDIQRLEKIWNDYQNRRLFNSCY